MAIEVERGSNQRDPGNIFFSDPPRAEKMLPKKITTEEGVFRKPHACRKGRTLIMMVGLPRSGKSTKARDLHRESGHPMVCPDAIRFALHDTRFLKEQEHSVWFVAKAMVAALFLAGHDTVILDATNNTRQRRDKWVSDKWRREYVEVNTPKEECLKRARDKDDDEIIPVIERMAAEHEPVTNEEWDKEDMP